MDLDRILKELVIGYGWEKVLTKLGDMAYEEHDKICNRLSATKQELVLASVLEKIGKRLYRMSNDYRWYYREVQENKIRKEKEDG